jgi:TPR repeat protein
MKVDPAASKLEQQRLEKKHPCPFCRGRFRQLQGVYSSQLLGHAKMGKSWAQYEVGRSYLIGVGVTKDLKQALGWFKMSADQGYTLGMAFYGLYLHKGAPNIGLASSEEGARAYSLPAARQGNGNAQFVCSLYAHTRNKPEESSMWSALAASQLDAYAETMVAADCYYGRNGVPRSLFAAIYWLREAATKGQPDASSVLPELLLEAKIKLYGAPDIVGYSAIPEATLWADFATGYSCRLLGGANLLSQYLYNKPDYPCFDLSVCHCCGKRAQRDSILSRCSKCKAVAYCGKKCQAVHWKLGHKVDCEGVEKFRVLLHNWTNHVKALTGGKEPREAMKTM